MVHGMIGALWDAIPQRQLNYAMAATTAYVGYVLMSYRGDMNSALAFRAATEADKKVCFTLREGLFIPCTHESC